MSAATAEVSDAAGLDEGSRIIRRTSLEVVEAGGANTSSNNKKNNWFDDSLDDLNDSTTIELIELKFDDGVVMESQDQSSSSISLSSTVTPQSNRSSGTNFGGGGQNKKKAAKRNSLTSIHEDDFLAADEVGDALSPLECSKRFDMLVSPRRANRKMKLKAGTKAALADSFRSNESSLPALLDMSSKDLFSPMTIPSLADMSARDFFNMNGGADTSLSSNSSGNLSMLSMSSSSGLLFSPRSSFFNAQKKISTLPLNSPTPRKSGRRLSALEPKLNLRCEIPQDKWEEHEFVVADKCPKAAEHRVSLDSPDTVNVNNTTSSSFVVTAKSLHHHHDEAPHPVHRRGSVEVPPPAPPAGPSSDTSPMVPRRRPSDTSVTKG